MEDILLIVDIGTQSLRASIIDTKGEVLAFSQQKYETPFFSVEDGFAEQNPDYYMDKLVLATNDLATNYSEAMSKVKSMVMVCFRDSSVILDENYKPIRPSILWLDQRITRIPHMNNLKWYEKVLFSLIGMSDAVKYNAERTPTYWLMEHEKENWNKMKYYAPIGTYFNYVVTGNFVVSSADCAGHYPFNFKTGKWFSSLHPKHDVFSIPQSALPPIVKVGSVIGCVSEEFSKRSRIPLGTKLIASGSDKSCETLGNGCIDKTTASVSLGTACSIDVVYNKYVEPETFLPSYQTPYSGDYDLEVQIYRGLWMIKWYLDNFGVKDVIESEKLGISVEEYLNQKISKIPAGSDGLVLQPYWGPGLKRPNSKGSIVGFSGVHTRYHLYKSIIEGIAFAIREGLDEIVRKTHYKPKKIILSGGGSQSEEFDQIFADILGIDCYRSQVVESSSLGAAMSGFISLGVYKNPKDAVKNMVKEGFKIKANENNHVIYEKLYNKVYKKMYPSLKKIYNNCKNFYLDYKNA